MEFMTVGSKVGGYVSYESADGKRWRKMRNETARLVMPDRSTFFLNPLRELLDETYSSHLCVLEPSMGGAPAPGFCH